MQQGSSTWIMCRCSRGCRAVPLQAKLQPIPVTHAHTSLTHDLGLRPGRLVRGGQAV